MKKLISLLLCGMIHVAILACGGTVATQTPLPDEPTHEAMPFGDTTHILDFGGEERSYVLHIPPGYDASRPTALVLAFHGITLDANEMIRISGLNSQSVAAGFVVVYPNASGEQRSWNGGHCCGESALHNVDDIGFVRALIEELATYLNLDRNRIYATGFSNDAILVYRLACEMADQIAAIGPVSATQALEDMLACRPSRPVPVIHFHGTDDEPNPYYGSTSPGGVQFISVNDEITFWISTNDCPNSAREDVTGNIIHDTYAPCRNGSAVELYTVSGGKHAWPGGEAVKLRMGEPTMEISATSLIEISSSNILCREPTIRSH